MDLEEIKRILQKDKGKIIIVENGKPLMVILPYEKLSGENNQEEEIGEALLDEEETDSLSGELTIDDLPI